MPRRRAARPSLLVLNQYYWPGLEATAYLLSQLCAALAEDYDVTVITGRLAIPRAETPDKSSRLNRACCTTIIRSGRQTAGGFISSAD